MLITVDNLRTMPIGTFVFPADHNSHRYKYIGIHFNDVNKKDMHVFLSDYFVSTLIISVDTAHRNIHINKKALYDNRDEAVARYKVLKDEGDNIFG